MCAHTELPGRMVARQYRRARRVDPWGILEGRCGKLLLLLLLFCRGVCVWEGGGSLIILYLCTADPPVPNFLATLTVILYKPMCVWIERETSSLT